MERFIGVMTGTSCDGIDIAVVDFFPGSSLHFPTFKLIFFETTPYPSYFKEQLYKVATEPISIAHFAELHIHYAELIAKAIREILPKIPQPSPPARAIGLSGQTIWHQPNSSKYIPHCRGVTLQVGSGTALAALLQLPVVWDFRTTDVLLGGEGAPLIPIFDYAFLADVDEPTIAVNIGGIANITLLPPRTTGIPKSLIAFDTGPGNTLIDAATQQFFQLPYDPGGAIAASGAILPSLLESMQSDAFFKQNPPKSTGKEYFNWSWVQSHIEKAVKNTARNPVDIVTTLTYFTAWSIAFHIRNYTSLEKGKIYISGGGVHNSTLLRFIQELLPEYTILPTDHKQIPADAKEAIGFAYLAYLTWHSYPGNIPSVTGAEKPAVLGSIANPVTQYEFPTHSDS